MRNYFVAISLLLLISSLSFAQQQNLPNPGVTPDNFLWGLDVAFDQLTLLLTFDAGEKAKKSLEIARERLAEVREMVLQNKLEASQKAQLEHANFLNVAKDSLRVLSRDNSTRELEDEIEVEKNIEGHEEEIEAVSNELKVKIEIKGLITKEQQTLVDSVLSNLQNRTAEVKIKIENKKGETKIKIKQKTGKTDKEVEETEDGLEKKTGLKKAREKKLKIDVDIAGNASQVKVENKFVLNTTTREAIVNGIINRMKLTRNQILDVIDIKPEEEKLKEKLEIKAEVEGGLADVEVEIRFPVNSTDNETIINEILNRMALSEEQVEKALELKLGEEKLEIEVEIEKGEAEVEIEKGKSEWKFNLVTADKEAIISEIISRTGLTREEIDKVIKFDIEEKEIKGEKKGKKDLEINVEIEKERADVKIEKNNTEFKFVLNTTNRTAIVSEIANRTGLTNETIEAAIKIETKDEKKEKEVEKSVSSSGTSGSGRSEGKETKDEKKEEKSSKADKSESSSSGKSGSGKSEDD